jgi:hypothetical protein
MAEHRQLPLVRADAWRAQRVGVRVVHAGHGACGWAFWADAPGCLWMRRSEGS